MALSKTLPCATNDGNPGPSYPWLISIHSPYHLQVPGCDSIRGMLERLYIHTRIQTRHMAVPDFCPDDAIKGDDMFFPEDNTFEVRYGTIEKGRSAIWQFCLLLAQEWSRLLYPYPPCLSFLINLSTGSCRRSHSQIQRMCRAFSSRCLSSSDWGCWTCPWGDQ